jgi:hypothetical protein
MEEMALKALEQLDDLAAEAISHRKASYDAPQAAFVVNNPQDPPQGCGFYSYCGPGFPPTYRC